MPLLLDAPVTACGLPAVRRALRAPARTRGSPAALLLAATLLATTGGMAAAAVIFGGAAAPGSDSPPAVRAPVSPR